MTRGRRYVVPEFLLDDYLGSGVALTADVNAGRWIGNADTLKVVVFYRSVGVCINRYYTFAGQIDVSQHCGALGCVVPFGESEVVETDSTGPFLVGDFFVIFLGAFMLDCHCIEIPAGLLLEVNDVAGEIADLVIVEVEYEEVPTAEVNGHVLSAHLQSAAGNDAHEQVDCVIGAVAVDPHCYNAVEALDDNRVGLGIVVADEEVVIGVILVEYVIDTERGAAVDGGTLLEIGDSTFVIDDTGGRSGAAGLPEVTNAVHFIDGLCRYYGAILGEEAEVVCLGNIAPEVFDTAGVCHQDSRIGCDVLGGEEVDHRVACDYVMGSETGVFFALGVLDSDTSVVLVAIVLRATASK